MTEIGGAMEKGLQSASSFFKKVGTWLKKHIIPVVAVALAIIAMIVTVSILTNKFRAGKVDNLSVGDTKERVAKVLGKADVEEEFAWHWFDCDNTDLYEEAQEIILQMETVEAEEQRETLIAKLEDIKAEILGNSNKNICVRFDENEMVQEVLFDRKYDASMTGISKKAKKVESDVLIIEDVGGADGAVAKIYYQDGSYRSKYYDFSSILFEGRMLTATAMKEAGEYVFSCSDDWGGYTWMQEVKSYAIDDFTRKTNVLLETDTPDVRMQVKYLGTRKYPYLILSDVSISGTEMDAADLLVVQPGCRVINAMGLGSKIRSVQIPDGVVRIVDEAFASWNRDEIGCLSSVKIGSGVASIGLNAFQNTAYVEDEANWENGALYIGQYLIKADASDGISIKEGTKVIADGAISFVGMAPVPNVYIPKSVKNTGRFFLRGISAQVSVSEGNTMYEVEDGVLYANGKQTLVYYPRWKEDNTFTVPDGVKKIDGYAFYGCANLWEVTLPNGVEEVEAYAFGACTSLTTFTIPASVTKFGGKIGDTSDGDWQVFPWCTNLKEIYNLSPHVDVRATNCLQDTVSWGREKVKETWEGQEFVYYIEVAFAHTSLDEPRVVSVDENGFATVLISAANVVEMMGEDSAQFDDAVPAGELLFAYCGTGTNLTIPESVVAIADGALQGNKKITSVTVGSHVVYVGKNAFEKCTSLTDVFVDAKYIGAQAFFECRNIVRGQVGENTNYVGADAFYNAFVWVEGNVRATLILGNGLQYVGAKSFGGGYYHLDTVYFTGTEEEWNAIEKVDGWDQNVGLNREYTVIFNYVEE